MFNWLVDRLLELDKKIFSFLLDVDWEFLKQDWKDMKLIFKIASFVVLPLVWLSMVAKLNEDSY